LSVAYESQNHLDTTISLMWCDAYAPHFRICKVSVKSSKSLVGQWFICANRKFLWKLSV